MEHHDVCIFDVELNGGDILNAKQVLGGLELNDALIFQIFVFFPGPFHLPFLPLDNATLSIFNIQHFYQPIYLINFVPCKFLERFLLDEDIDDVFS